MPLRLMPTLWSPVTDPHGRPPAGPEVLRLRQQATLETRPDNTYRSLAEMTDRFRHRTAEVLAHRPDELVDGGGQRSTMTRGRLLA
jgi:hypothetical protein